MAEEKPMNQRYVGEDVPRAHSVELGRCDDPECGAVHMILLTASGEPIAVCVLTPQQIERAIAWHKYAPGPGDTP
jgi:hypothetical protein